LSISSTIGVETLVLNKPGVGSNLQDHVMVNFELVPESLDDNLERIGFGSFMNVNPFNYWTYFTNPGPYNGPLSDCYLSSGAFFHTPSNKDKYKRPDVQMHSIPMLMSFDFGTVYWKTLSLNDTVKQMYYDHLGGDGVTLLPSLMRPKSREYRVYVI